MAMETGSDPILRPRSKQPGSDSLEPAVERPSAQSTSQDDLDEATRQVQRCEHEWRAGGGVWIESNQVERLQRNAELCEAQLQQARERCQPSRYFRHLFFVHVIARSGVLRLGRRMLFGYGWAALFGLSMLVSPLFFSTIAGAFIGSLIWTVVGGGLLSWVLLKLWPDDNRYQSFRMLDRQWREAKAEAAILGPRLKVSRAAYEAAHRQLKLCQQLEQARKRQQALVATIKSANYQLLQTDWRAMRKPEFKDFLRSVFENLQYDVGFLRSANAQGADLLASGKGRRIAILANTSSTPIDERSIREVCRAKAIYQCDACAVITSSRFTRPALEFGKTNGCTLIDGIHIPDLIEGKYY